MPTACFPYLLYFDDTLDKIFKCRGIPQKLLYVSARDAVVDNSQLSVLYECRRTLHRPIFENVYVFYLINAVCAKFKVLCISNDVSRISYSMPNDADGTLESLASA